MLICIDAGHYIGTPGKRCLKSIDPGETREWTLNSRVADKLEAILAGYSCQTMRVDDVTGKRDVTLSQRVAAANRAKADVYLSIHHNAGNGAKRLDVVGSFTSDDMKCYFRKPGMDQWPDFLGKPEYGIHIGTMCESA